MSNIGIIGLGTMGMGIASNLVKCDYLVKGYDIKPAQRKIFAALGGIAVDSCADAGNDVEALFLMVFNAEQVESVLFGENGAAAQLKHGSVVVITASVGKDICESVAERLDKKGVHLIDCPVRGGAVGAGCGELYLMVATPKPVFEAHKTLLNDIGGEIVYVGEHPGMGQLAKTCMQAFFSLAFQTTYEVLSLGTAAGLDAEVVYRILNATGASSDIFRNTAKNVAQRSFTNTGNPLSILDKDVHIALGLANEHHLTVPAIEATARSFSESMKLFPTEDVWAAVKVLEQSAGIEVKFDIIK